MLVFRMYHFVFVYFYSFFFFFKQKTAYEMRISDWSSDVCSSDLLYDYYGFPEHTYRLRWDAPGAPDLGRRVADLLAAAGIASDEEHERGWDHGVFVPMKVMAHEAEIPLLQLSLRAELDTAAHFAVGRAPAA